MDFKTWIAVASIVIALAALIDRVIERRRNDADKLREEVKKSIEKVADKVGKLKDELRASCTDVAILKTKMEVFWKVIEVDGAKFLHAPIHDRRDELLDRLTGEREPPLTSIEDVDELYEEMQAVIDAPREEKPGARWWATMIKARCEVLKVELLAKAGRFDARQPS